MLQEPAAGRNFMSCEGEDRRLFREAADLAIRLQNDPSNPVSVDMVRNWVARGPLHAATWARVAEIHGMTGKILAGQHRAEQPAALSRRAVLTGAGAGLGAIALGAWGVPLAMLHARADHITTTAQIRRLKLPDGSVMTLGPDSAVAVGYSDAGRTVGLLSGMAFFEVAHDARRPFSVQAGPVTATALGTAFDVSDDAGFISVSVSQGTVEARDRQLSTTERLSTRETFQIAAWREGMIVAERETVSAMVAKISRWLPGRVVMADPSLGSREVSGVFDLSNPSRALEAVVSPFGAKLRHIGSMMTVISPV
jgi:transmembrane sensor